MCVRPVNQPVYELGGDAAKVISRWQEREISD